MTTSRQFVGWLLGTETSLAVTTYQRPYQLSDERLCVPDRLARLIRAIGDLPARCREIFLLCRFEGLSHADAADRLVISASAVVRYRVNAMAAIEYEMDSPR